MVVKNLIRPKGYFYVALIGFWYQKTFLCEVMRLWLPTSSVYFAWWTNIILFKISRRYYKAGDSRSPWKSKITYKMLFLPNSMLFISHYIKGEAGLKMLMGMENTCNWIFPLILRKYQMDSNERSNWPVIPDHASFCIKNKANQRKRDVMMRQK